MAKDEAQRTLWEDLHMLLRVAKLGGELSPYILPTYIAQALLEAASPFISIVFPALLLEELVGNRDISRIVWWAGCIAVLNFATGVLKSILQRRIEGYAIEMDSLLALKVNEKTMSLDYEHMEDTAVQNMLQAVINSRQWVPSRIESQMKLFGDVLKSLVQLLASLGLVAGLLKVPSVGGHTGFFAFVDSSYAFAALFALLIVALLVHSYAATTQTSSWREFNQNNVPNQRRSLYYWYLFDDYRLGKDIRLYNLADLLENDIRQRQQVMTASSKTYLHRRPLPATTGNTILTAITSGAIYMFVALKALLGSIAVGQALLYIGAINQFSVALNSLSGYIVTMRGLTPFSENYFSYLELPQRKDTGAMQFDEHDKSSFEIEFRDVSFRYPGQEQNVLQHVSLKLRSGDRLAVVGRNGAGKTTFIKLLCRLYDPSEGAILFNGVDIREYDLAEYFRLFSVVFQDFKLFAYPLGENLSAAPTYDEDMAWSSLEDAGIADRAHSMPQGLEQFLYKNVSPDGIDVSGGEAQKIAIARSLYKNAPFIIMDEPTAALDPISEYEIYANLDTLVGDKTAIFISHRLSSCRFCHHILVFDAGQVVQHGSHEDLVQDVDGLYAAMWQAQAQYYAETP